MNDLTIKETPRELVLKIESSEHVGQLLFVALEKNKTGTYLLFYKKHFYKEMSTVVDHLPAYFLKLYGSDILSIFDLYLQDLVKDPDFALVIKVIFSSTKANSSSLSNSMNNVQRRYTLKFEPIKL